MCRKNAILFPGIGAQYSNMGKGLLSNPKSKRIINHASEIINYDLISLLENGMDNCKSEILQPLLIAYGLASYELLKDYLEFNIFLGHSLGELEALTAAGYISLEDALLFSVERGRCYDSALGKGEVAIVTGMEEKRLSDIIEHMSEKIYITAYNTSTQFLVAGSSDGIKELGRIIQTDEAMFIPYSMLPHRKNIPVHCELMKMCNNARLTFSGEVRINSSIVFSSITGKYYANPKEVVDNLENQLYLPVVWKTVMQCLFSMNPNIIVDAGPQRILKDFATELLDNRYKANILAADVSSDFNQIKKEKR